MGRSKRRRHRKKSQGLSVSGAGGTAKTTAKKQQDDKPVALGRRSPHFWVGIAAAVIALGAGIFLWKRGTDRTPVEKHGLLNILLVTLDTTRADRVGCYGYAGGKTPNIDALARGGVLGKRSYARVPLTDGDPDQRGSTLIQF